MLRFFKNLTVVEWLTLGGVTLILGSFVFDEVRARLAEYNAGVAARQDIEDENWAFRIGGKRRHWFDMTSRIFREEHDAELVHSHGCCVSCEQWRYDARYNEV
ncbi:MAG TPA: hypothetical protein DDW52_06970, partial [Planctomycetaceae bacterium]|nr:hypothetical protein [Planctomycetaceae bacterium]